MGQETAEERGLLARVSQGGRGRTIGMLAGLVAGLLITVLGVLKSLILILCIVVGYLAGRYFDEEVAGKKGEQDEESRHLSHPPGVP